MTRVLAFSKRTFSSLGIRNYRLFFVGQLVSLSGTWLQAVAQSWLVLRLSGNGVAVGTVTGLQFLPMLLLGPWGGVVADRLDRRKLLMATQSVMAAAAAVLTVVTALGVVELWMVYAVAFVTGVATVFDVPARQAFVSEMVGKEALANAIGLNSAMFNTARVIGPAIAGALIVTVGVWPCFLVNTVSFVAVVGCLSAMRVDELRTAPAPPRARGQIREGVRYVWQSRERRILVAAVAVVGVSALNFQVVLPLLARYAFDGDAGAFSVMTAAMGVGSLLGALATAARARPSPGVLLFSCAIAAVSFFATAAAPTVTVAIVLLVPLGTGVMLFMATVNSLLQLGSDDRMRGRVMSLYALVFLGSTPLGAPTVGWLSEELGPRAALVLGGVGMLVGGALVARGFGSAGRLFGRRRGRGAGAAPSDALEPAAA